MVFYDYLLNLVTGEIVRRREADALTLPAERVRVCREALSDARAIETLGDEMRVEWTPEPIGCLFIWSKGVLCSMTSPAQRRQSSAPRGPGSHLPYSQGRSPRGDLRDSAQSSY